MIEDDHHYALNHEGDATAEEVKHTFTVFFPNPVDAFQALEDLSRQLKQQIDGSTYQPISLHFWGEFEEKTPH